MKRLSSTRAPQRDGSVEGSLERSVLATMATYPDCAPGVTADLGGLWSEVWTQPDTVLVAAAVRRLIDAQRPPDWCNLRQELSADPDEAEVVLDNLRRHCECAYVVSDRCAQLRGTVTLRRLLLLAEVIQSRANRDTVDELTSRAHAILVDAQSTGVRSITAAEAARLNWNLLVQRLERGSAITGIPLPWEPLSVATQGLQPGTTTILGARPSHGKTAIACNIAEYAAALGYPVLIFSHEMDSLDVFRRIAASRASISYTAIHSGRLTQVGSRERFRAANEDISRLPITVVDDVGLPPAHYQAMAISYAHRRGTKDRPLLVICDYLQLERIPGWRGGTRADELAQISASWLGACRRGRFALLALAQLNRTADNGEPRVAQLRDSGAIEQDAHAVLLLWREGHDNPAKPANKALLNLAKNRNGTLRRTLLHFAGGTMRFTLWDPHRHVERTGTAEGDGPLDEPGEDA